MNNFKFVPRIQRKILFLPILTSLLIIVLDQWTKYLVVLNKNFLEKPLVIILNFFNIVYVKNSGAAWGMFHGNNIVLLIISVIVFGILMYFHKEISEGYLERYFGLAMVVGGIIGNSFDRIFRGAVVDFLDFYIYSYHWPSFNIADSGICFGVTLLILSFIFRPSSKITIK